MNHTLRQPNIIRAAVANSKIVKLRNIGRNQLLLTGVRIGTTMVRVWDSHGNESVHLIKVVEPHTYENGAQVFSEGIVKVSMEFLELDVASARELGLKWPDTLEFRGAALLQGSENTWGLNYSASGISSKGFLNLLMQEGSAKTLAKPELFVRLGEMATFHSGGEVPIPTGSHNFGGFTKKVEWKSFGLSITVKPTSPDGYQIQSDVKITISELNPEIAIDGIPGINHRKIETKMDAVDGGTVVLSALLKQKSSERSEGIPFLSSIPILGHLFSANSKQNAEHQLIIAMTYSILNPEREQQRLDEFRDKFSD